MARIVKASILIFLVLLSLAIGCARKPPTITSISPNSGPSGGGTKITITGDNFKDGATVTIAGKPVKDMKIIDPKGTSVEAVTPGGPPGRQQVIANNLKAKEPSVPAYFTYEALKVVSTVPADGAQVPWYPRFTQGAVTFSQPVQAGSASITINSVGWRVSYDASAQTATFTADGQLRTGASYSVTIRDVKDMAGNVMTDYTFGFSIEEAVKVDWYTVQDGDTLPIIAAKPEVYDDDTKWELILAANQDEFVSEDGRYGNDIILDRRNLIPGMVLYIPR